MSVLAWVESFNNIRHLEVRKWNWPANYPWHFGYASNEVLKGNGPIGEVPVEKLLKFASLFTLLEGFGTSRLLVVEDGLDIETRPVIG